MKYLFLSLTFLIFQLPIFTSGALKNREVYAHSLIETLSIASHHKILDVGCGLGDLAFSLAELTPLGQVHGIDISSITVDSARKSHFLPNLRYTTVNLLDLNESDAYDRIIALDVFHLIPSKAAAVHVIFSLLREDGIAYITYPGKHETALKNALTAVCSKEKWAPFFQATKDRPSESLHELFCKTGFSSVETTERQQQKIFSSKIAFLSFLASYIPELAYLPRMEKLAFLNEVIEHYTSATGQSSAITLTLEEIEIKALKGEV